jgi:hypothetical protein
MKNLLKFLGIITIAVIIGISLSACEEDDGTSLPSAGNGSLGLTFEKVYDVTGAEGITTSNFWLRISKEYYDEEFTDKSINFPINEDQEWDYSDWLDQGFTHPIPGSQVKLENGKLTFKLGTPTQDFMDHFADDYSLDHWTNGSSSFDNSKLSATDGLKTIAFISLTDNDNRDGLRLRWGKSPAVMFVYANMDGNVSGSSTTIDYGGPSNWKYNWNLKKGWNTVIATAKQGEAITLITGTPNASIKWDYEQN